MPVFSIVNSVSIAEFILTLKTIHSQLNTVKNYKLYELGIYSWTVGLSTFFTFLIVQHKKHSRDKNQLLNIFRIIQLQNTLQMT